jgi:hypothetical protein
VKFIYFLVTARGYCGDVRPMGRMGRMGKEGRFGEGFCIGVHRPASPCIGVHRFFLGVFSAKCWGGGQK